MLDTSGVLVDGHPVVGQLGIERLGRIVRAGVAQEVPGRVDERVHRVGLPPSLLAADRTCGPVPIRLLGEGFVLGGQLNRQLVPRYGHDAVIRAVDDRDRRAPIPLTRDQPVP